MPRGRAQFETHKRQRSATPPDTLYKYVSLKTAQTIVKSGKLRFQSPLRYNDPFDCQWNPHWVVNTEEAKLFASKLLRKSLLDESVWPKNADAQHRRAAELDRKVLLDLPKTKREQHVSKLVDKYLFAKDTDASWRRKIRDIQERLRVFCLTEDPLSILMWSHYGSNHTGVVLCFDTSTLENSFSRPLEAVQYKSELPCLLDYKEWYRSIMFGLPRERTEGIYEALCLTKHEGWKYEKEWRFVWTSPPGTIGEFQDYTFSSEALIGVIYGCRVPSKDKDMLDKLLGDKFPDISSHTLIQHNSNFALDYA